MTPDLKRLCEAAWKSDSLCRDSLGEAGFDDAAEHEQVRLTCIVRAVLTALREPSEEVIDVMVNSSATWLGPQVVWQVAIDHILNEPATT